MSLHIFEKFDIVLDEPGEHKHPTSLYYAGETITGKILIVLREPATLRAVKLLLRGKANWLDESVKTSTKMVKEQTLVDRDLVLLERPPGRLPGTFPWAAQHAYELPFETVLPRQSATSYEGVAARLRYYLRATVVQALHNSGDRVFYKKKPITVLSRVIPTDVTTGDKGPSSLTTSDTVTVPIGPSCCCRQGKISAKMTLVKDTFFPGETVSGSVEVDSSQLGQKSGIVSVKCQLVDVPQHQDSGSVANTQHVVAQQAISQHTTNAVLLQIPPVPPSQLKDDSIVGTLPRSASPESIISNGTTKFSNPSLFTIQYQMKLLCNVAGKSKGKKDTTAHSDTVLTLSIPVNVRQLPNGQEEFFSESTGELELTAEPDEAGMTIIGKPQVYSPIYGTVCQMGSSKPGVTVLSLTS